MTGQLLANDWTIMDLSTGDIRAVTLPHDAMIGQDRKPDAPSQYHGAYFPGGRYHYRRQLVTEQGRRHRLWFEGIGGQARILVDDQELVTVDSRYRDFALDLDGALRPDGESTLDIEIDDSKQPNSRWYTGSGLYRPVWLDVTGPARFEVDGVRLFTENVLGAARVRAEVLVDGDADEVHIQLCDGDDIVAETRGRPGALGLTVPEPKLWSDLTPHLYDAVVTLLVAGEVSDIRRLRIGLRTLEVDARRGLRVNGRRVLLRGACIHHDSGILGAATFRDAEFRRARILKENGFNAVRSSHNPLSRDMLDACDEIGLYVIDELTDVWVNTKTTHDTAPRFDEVWRDDLRAMVTKDRNHPSVIMYSIGNEIPESATAIGVAIAQQLSAFAHELDPTRPTTLAVNFLLNVLASRGKSVFSRKNEGVPTRKNAATSTIANVIANKLGSITQFVAKLPAADKATRDAYAAVDVAGYNYAFTRYRSDARRYPDRVICGSESMPGDIAKIWPLVEANPSVIGDFMWTGWDYLGETGLGDWAYGRETVPLTKPYPQITANTGAIDINGHPLVGSFLARAVWGELKVPQITVRPLDVAGQQVRRSAWRTSDAVASWAWQGKAGVRTEVEVYSVADEVELILNGRSLGRRRSGRARGYVARFRVDYAPGELVAVAYDAGVETARSSLRSADRPSLVIEPESPVISGCVPSLGFVRVELRDAEGTVEMLDDDDVEVVIDGPASLVGFGSAASANAESYIAHRHRTYRGRALAVVRAHGSAGRIVIRAHSDRHGDAQTELIVEDPAETTTSAEPAQRRVP